MKDILLHFVIPFTCGCIVGKGLIDKDKMEIVLGLIIVIAIIISCFY